MKWSKATCIPKEGYWISSSGLLLNKDGKLLKYRDNGKGYVSINIGNKTYYQHRLVAQTFIPNPFGLPEVNHLDEVKTNNVASNLEWCSISYNRDYGTRNVRSRIGKLESGRKRRIKAEFHDGNIRYYNGVREASEELGLSTTQVCALLRGDRNSWFGTKFTDTI